MQRRSSVKVADTQSMQVFCGLFFWGFRLVEKPTNWNNWIFLGKNNLAWPFGKACMNWWLKVSALVLRILLINHHWLWFYMIFKGTSSPMALGNVTGWDRFGLSGTSITENAHSDNGKMMVRLPQRVPWKISMFSLFFLVRFHTFPRLRGCLFVRLFTGCCEACESCLFQKQQLHTTKKMRNDNMRKILFLPKTLRWKMGPSKIGFL